MAANGILATAPLTPGHRPFVALSMVQHSDIAAYLVAIKSFDYFMQPRQIVVVCDPTITPDDIQLLGQHQRVELACFGIGLCQFALAVGTDFHDFSV